MLRMDDYSIANPEMVWLTARVLWCVKRLGDAVRLRVEGGIWGLIFGGVVGGRELRATRSGGGEMEGLRMEELGINEIVPGNKEGEDGAEDDIWTPEHLASVLAAALSEKEYL